ncbi:LRR receptor-like serine/threonine-protein kinase GHR1 [Sesamum angolense]|uniref:LRR receptor-like serine/threonine-protein kinase GHR1 n=1 Tax=Sesamum angolense TaxID=2727404 RepID=A0AAE1W468_9LAMI|nr:LRR receptor-like serine/threonine-protein kinase GHR1 [Sesamum angolense]
MDLFKILGLLLGVVVLCALDIFALSDPELAYDARILSSWRGELTKILEKSMKRSNDKQLKIEHELCLRVKASLEEGKDARLVEWKAADIEILNTFQLLTAKPVVYLVNMNEKDYQRKKNKFLPKIHAWVQEHGGETIIPFSCVLERNLADYVPRLKLLSIVRRTRFKDLTYGNYENQHMPISSSYSFTIADLAKVKCWQIRRQTKAPQAAGTIHTDFEKGFICAEVMKFEDLKELGSESAVKESQKRWNRNSQSVNPTGFCSYGRVKAMLLELALVFLYLRSPFTSFLFLSPGAFVRSWTTEKSEKSAFISESEWLCCLKKSLNVCAIGRMKLFWLSLVCLCFVSALSQLPSRDILALLEFKKGIKHDPTGFVLDSWNDESVASNGCPSTWYGIMCDGGNVAAVVLDNLGLVADVDLSVFTNLTMLVKLSISNNSITGKLPNKLSNFKSLEYLDVSENMFSSSLPSDIGKLVSLKNLSLAGNNFSGSIPDTISGLASIRSLDMSSNSLSGPLPSSLIRLGGLVYLNLSLNGFTKSIPKGLELMKQLDVLDLHGNMLDGKFDPEFLLQTTARYVDLSGNLLTSFSTEQQNFLVGVSPSIKHLNLSHNQLTGSLGSGGEAEAFVLKLGNNRFSGSIPNNLLKGDSLILTELDLSGNSLSGPVSMITSTTLHTLNLSSNVLSGELPPLTGSCSVVDLSTNQFEGNLTRLLKWGNIEVLDLSQNRLTGSIPEVTAQFLRLNYLNLSHNSLNGSLPKVITLFPKLVELDLSFNQLDGPLLNTLLTSSTLRQIHLQGNRLSGSIDFSPSSGDLDLQVLDLSYNQLGGHLPDEYGLFTGLQVLNIAGNNFSGSIPTSICNISALTSLDISRNHFTGPLPKNLSNSLQSFNASYNDFWGVVPENLRTFPLSSFYPGNSELEFPNPPPGSDNVPPGNASKKQDLVTSQKGSASEIISPDEKTVAKTSFSPSKTSHLSWSPESGDSYAAENPSRLEVRSPDRLAGELYFLDDTISFTAEELSRAPAEVLGRSSHGTSYRATLDSGLLLTVKWLREGVAKQRKEFAKEAKKFANIRHPNVVGLRGYYWGPTQHEKLILSDYISPGSLASFLYGIALFHSQATYASSAHLKLLYNLCTNLICSTIFMTSSMIELSFWITDRPGRKAPPLNWAQRLKIAVDVARGLNYLHFDRAVPHGNLKANNVLLDGPDLNGRVADYCLHRLMTQSGTIEQILDAGVLGYRAPELAASKKPVPSFKSDIYAFGVILLELLSGKCAGDVVSGDDGGVDLTDWVRLRVAEGQGSDCFDAALAPEMSTPAADKGMKEVLGIALRCIRSVSERPGIKTVYEDLSAI